MCEVHDTNMADSIAFVILLHQVRASCTSMEGAELRNDELDLS